MDRKELFNIWAPQEGEVWTKFAKPALFIHADNATKGQNSVANIPLDIWQMKNNQTAFIVDLPGATSVETGLGLTKIGYKPIPLYNGVHEPKNGDLRNAVDNTAIINALVAGSDTLQYTSFSADPPPAFLLDSNRNPKLSSMENIYDNRWNVDTDDMPNAAYMKVRGISRVLIWSDGNVRDDLIPIINSYHDAGITIATYIDGKINYERTRLVSSNTTANELFGHENAVKIPQVLPQVREAVRNFENARFGLLVVTAIALFNLFGMFFINTEPLLWTAPSIMWMTYLWIPEILGDIIAIGLTISYISLFLLSCKRRSLMRVAFVLLGVDFLVFYAYAVFYGIVAFTGHSFIYGLLVFVPPAVLSRLLIKGNAACRTLEEVSDSDYSTALDHIDDNFDNGSTPGLFHPRPRRRFFRFYRTTNYRRPSYRGYGGYGGTGRGGYGGGGFGGFGG